MGYYSINNYIYLPSICNRKGIKINFSNIKGLLLDLEGVVYEGDKLVDGALDTINKLLSYNFKIKYLTNTTVTPRKQILKKLLKFKLSIIESDIFTPPIAVPVAEKLASWNGSATPRDSEGINDATDESDGPYSRGVLFLQKRP